MSRDGDVTSGRRRRTHAAYLRAATDGFIQGIVCTVSPVNPRVIPRTLDVTQMFMPLFLPRLIVSSRRSVHHCCRRRPHTSA